MKKAFLAIVIGVFVLLTLAFKTNAPPATHPTPKVEGCGLTFNVTAEGWDYVLGVSISNVFGYTTVLWGSTGQYSLTADSTVIVETGHKTCYPEAHTWGQYTWNYCNSGSSGGVLTLPANRYEERYAVTFICNCPLQGVGNLHDAGGLSCAGGPPPSQ